MKSTLKKRLSEYAAVVFDMDGTLYFQTPVRVCMFLEMLLHFWCVREFFVVQQYRKLYELGLTDQERFALLSSDAPQIVNDWMLVRPMKYVRRFRDKELLSLIRTLRGQGVKIIVYSDYPLDAKLNAVELAPDYAYYSGDKIISCQKPNPKGLLSIIAEINEKPENIAFIGDKFEKDGLCADAAGINYAILPKSAKARNSIYKKI